MRTGTNHFVSVARANSYYRVLGLAARDVRDKIKSGDIAIGKPQTEKKTAIDEDGRYWIED